MTGIVDGLYFFYVGIGLIKRENWEVSMSWSLAFVVNSILLGVGLAMDAFSVSMANGLNETHMKKGKMLGIAGTFGGFQAVMPMIGWICVHTIVEYFSSFDRTHSAGVYRWAYDL